MSFSWHQLNWVIKQFDLVCVWSSDERPGSALSGHHDGHGSHALQRGLTHGVRVRVLLPVSGCGRGGGGRAQTQRAVTAGHDGRGGGRVSGDHQSLGRGQGVAAVGIGGARRGVTQRAGSAREGLTRVAVVARVGVGVVVWFGVVPVAAVVGVGGRQRVVL